MFLCNHSFWGYRHLPVTYQIGNQPQNRENRLPSNPVSEVCLEGEAFFSDKHLTNHVWDGTICNEDHLKKTAGQHLDVPHLG